MRLDQRRGGDVEGGAVLMFAEVAAYAQSKGLTVPELLDDLYCEYGYFKETLHSLVLEGAEGAAQIDKLATSYSENPPAEVDGSPNGGDRVGSVVGTGKGQRFEQQRKVGCGTFGNRLGDDGALCSGMFGERGVIVREQLCC